MINKINGKNLTWTHITNPTKEDFSFLESNYKFHDLDIEDCKSKVKRPKFEAYDDYKFIVFNFPVMEAKGYKIKIEELNIFWGKDYLITICSKNLTKINHIFYLNTLDKYDEMATDYFSKGSDYLLYKILHEMVLMIFPLMTHIGGEIDYLDTNFENIKASNVIERLSALRRNIIFLQTFLKPQKWIFSVFENQLVDQEEKDMDIYWGDLGDYTGKLLDMAEDYQELVEGLYSSIDTLLSYRTTNVMKVLTTFNIIMLPLNFITSFYGMNIKLPFQDFKPETLFTAFLLTVTMAVIVSGMIIYFKFKKF